MSVQSQEREAEVRAAVLMALEDSDSDFRTLGSLSKQLGVSKRRIEMALNQLGDTVRKPISARPPRYWDWYRLTDKGLTKQEKRIRFWSFLGREW